MWINYSWATGGLAVSQVGCGPWAWPCSRSSCSAMARLSATYVWGQCCFDPNGHGSRQGRSADFMAGTAGALDGSDLIVSTTHTITSLVIAAAIRWHESRHDLLKQTGTRSAGARAAQRKPLTAYVQNDRLHCRPAAAHGSPTHRRLGHSVTTDIWSPHDCTRRTVWQLNARIA